MFLLWGCSVKDVQDQLVAELQAEVERLQMQLAACGVVAMANTRETATKQRDMHPDYMSVSCQDVMATVDREMALREERDQLKARIKWLEFQAMLGPGDPAAAKKKIEEHQAEVIDWFVELYTEMTGTHSAELMDFKEQINSQLRQHGCAGL